MLSNYIQKKWKILFTILILFSNSFMYSQNDIKTSKIDKLKYKNTPFNYSGNWKIENIDLNVLPKTPKTAQPFPVTKNDFLNSVFIFNQAKMQVSFKPFLTPKKTFKSNIEIHKKYMIMRTFTGGFNNIIFNTSSNTAEFHINRPAFFLFICHLKIRRTDFATYQEYEDEHSRYYEYLIKNYSIKNDENIILYLKLVQ